MNFWTSRQTVGGLLLRFVGGYFLFFLKISCRGGQLFCPEISAVKRQFISTVEKRSIILCHQ